MYKLSTGVLTAATLKMLRKNAKLSQEDCAKLLDITPAYLSLVERGHKLPSRKVLNKACHVFSVSPTVFTQLTSDLLELMQSVTEGPIDPQLLLEILFILDLKGQLKKRK